MTDTTFVAGTPIVSDWLNDINDAVYTTLALKSTIASPTFTGTPAAPTAAVTTSTTQLATTAFVRQFKQVTQVVYNIVGSVATGTTVIPLDDTIPQNTEGDQYMTQTITPISATSILVIEATFIGSNSAANTMVAALFQDTTASALATAAHGQSTADGHVHINLCHIMVSGTTSATTFKLRVGGNAAGTTTFNGAATARRFGGTMASGFRITEYLP